MNEQRRSILFAAVIGVLIVVSEGSAARDVVDGWERGYYSHEANPLPGQETWVAHYARHAQISNGPERKLANGVRWRLATDRQTKIAMPRIVWMPDNTNRSAANRMLEMVHGGAILFAKQQQEGFLSYVKSHEGDEVSNRHFQHVRKHMPKHVVTQTDVALTYASNRFVSLIDLGFIFRDEGTLTPRIIRGLILDLNQQQIFTMEACPEGSFRRLHDPFHPTFRFSNLLEICDEASVTQFEAAVIAEDDRIREAAAGSKDSLSEGCRDVSRRGEQEFVVYLAVGGLAVHLTQFGSNADTSICSLTLSARNPLIIPYRAVEPLMKPGALREELLKTK